MASAFGDNPVPKAAAPSRVLLSHTPEQIAAKIRYEKSPKQKLFLLHSWLGFHLALLLATVLLTGTIAVVSDEIDWLFHPEMRVQPGDTKVSWGELEKAVRAAAPNDALRTLQRGEADYFAYRASLLTPSGVRYFLHVDQWTGEVTGRTHPLTVQRFFRDLHRYLFTPSIISLPIVCSMGLVMLLSLYTGLKTAGRLRVAAFRLRTHQGLRVFLGDFHKVVAIWSLWFLVLIAVTGLWYLAEFGGAIAGKRFEPPRTGLSTERIEEFGSVIPRISTNEIIRRAEAAIPDWEPSAIFYPSAPGRPMMVWGRWIDPFVRDRANRVSLDPMDGSIIQISRSTENGVVAYLNDVADPLHFGDLGESLTIKLIWFLFGLGLCTLSFTGVWLSFKRLKKVSLSTAQLSTTPVLIAAIVFGYAYVQRYLDPGTHHQALAESLQVNGALTIRAVHSYVEEDDSQWIRIRVRHKEGMANFSAATVELANKQSIALKPVFYGPETILQAKLDPSETRAPLTVTSITLVDGAATELELTPPMLIVDSASP
ncbi:MAG: PepSY-associated TM helix domain-containing protein [Pseudomonadota bacterium]